MASAATPTLAERADIHKSCKSLETLLSVVNDYCEAAGAVVMLQKKLGKALKETGALKVTGDIPSNAINTSANVFEILSEINSKFTKIIDKEYDAISAEVQKWFKKLAKEEKIYDDKLEKINLRIKQAGQLYEKKSKKNPREAVEEHARYINLLSTLGPEVSQEKYNHALLVTQRHTAITYSVAAFVSRIADAEWLRTCEAARRFATPIGRLGEWRALCEGGWMGARPPDLPRTDNSQPDPSSEKNVLLSWSQDGGKPTTLAVKSKDGEAPRREAADQSRTDGRTATGNNSNGQRSPDSHPSLEAFPAPPTHLPLPPSQPTPLRQQTSRASSVSPQLSRLAESPVEDNMELTKYTSERDYPSISPVSSEPRTQLPNEPHPSDSSENASMNPPYFSPEAEFGVQNATNLHRKREYLQERRDDDVGIDRNESYGQVESKNEDSREKIRGIERTETGGSSGSIVAAMRRRYSQQSGAISPAPKDVPRLPLSVTDLASRYQPIDGPSSPHQRTMSPPNNRQLPIPPSDTPFRTGESSSYQGHNERSPPPGMYNAPSRSVAPRPSPPVDYDPQPQRRQQIDEQAERGIREKELELRAKEREIEMRVRELDMERARLTNERLDAYGSDHSSQRGNSRPFPSTHYQQQQRSQVEFPVTLSDHQQHSYNNNNNNDNAHLAPPSDRQSLMHPQASPSSRPRHQSLSHGQPLPRSQESLASEREAREHAPFCGCDQCSVSKYKTRSAAPSPQDLRPPEQPINLRPQPEKAKSWMRRLSMPVGMGNAFSLDSKKSLGTLRSGNVLEDGRMVDKRSYEGNAVTNRSFTNLGRR